MVTPVSLVSPFSPSTLFSFSEEVSLGLNEVSLEALEDLSDAESSTSDSSDDTNSFCLSFDVLTIVIKYLNPKQKNILRLTSKIFKEAVDYERRSLILLRLPKVSELKRLRQFTFLKCLDLSQRGIKDSHMKVVVHVRRLQNLELHFSDITDKSLKYISRLKELRLLRLSHCYKISSKGLKNISILSQLEHVELPNCSQLKNFALKCFSQLANLKYLNLKGCKSITDYGLMHLQNCKKLVSLNIAECSRITDEGLSVFEELADIKSLNISNLTYLTLDGIKKLRCLRELSELFLNGCYELEDSALQEIIHHHTKLKKLSLCNLSLLTDDGFEGVEALEGLIYLDVSLCNLLGDISATSISRLTNLEHLDLSYCDLITDQGMEDIFNLNKLLWLDISFCIQVTENGLMSMNLETCLESLFLNGLDEVSEEFIDQFNNFFPSIRVSVG
jgi:F-box/leucine-rich repeat protein 14